MKEIPQEKGANLWPPDPNYTYFENCEVHPFRYDSEQFELVNAWWLADAAFLAYGGTEFIGTRLKNTNLSFKFFDSGHSTQCFVAHNDNFVIVSFRGTEKFYYPDIFIDSRVKLIQYGARGQVHQGFKEAIDEIWEKNGNLKAYLESLKHNSPRTFWFTGHSLGGALATLAADRFGDVHGVYTYGSPKVGDNNFCEGYPLKNKTYRFVHNNDIIPRITPPPQKISFKIKQPNFYGHLGRLKYINSDGSIEDDPSLVYRLQEGLRGYVAYLSNIWKNIRLRIKGHLKPGIDFPSKSMADHMPIFYSIHIWNYYYSSA
ncbi:MAG: lipase family protein [Ardenticatenaceae bacterium]